MPDQVFKLSDLKEALSEHICSQQGTIQYHGKVIENIDKKIDDNGSDYHKLMDGQKGLEILINDKFNAIFTKTSIDFEKMSSKQEHILDHLEEVTERLEKQKERIEICDDQLDKLAIDVSNLKTQTETTFKALFTSLNKVETMFDKEDIEFLKKIKANSKQIKNFNYIIGLGLVVISATATLIIQSDACIKVLKSWAGIKDVQNVVIVEEKKEEVKKK